MKRCGSSISMCKMKRAKALERSISDPVNSELRNGIGYFDYLPLELKYRCLSYLSIDDLILMSSVSKQMKLLVELFVNSGHCFYLRIFHRPHCLLEDPRSNTFHRLCDNHKKIGLLFRAVSSDLTPSECLRFLERQLSNHVCSHDNHNSATTKGMAAHRSSVDASHTPSNLYNLSSVRCPALYLFGYFLYSFTRGWSEADQTRVFHSLVQLCFGENFWRRVTTLVCQEPGKDPVSELSVRIFLRRIFLDPLSLPRPASRLLSIRCSATAPNSSGTPGLSVDRGRPRDTFSQTYLTSTPKQASGGCLPGTDFFQLASSSVANTSSNFQNFPKDKIPQEVTSQESRFTFDESSLKLRLSASSVIRSTSSATSTSLFFWEAAGPLLRILRSYPSVQQARILFILYGPLHKGRLMWRTMCENTAADSEQLSACFGELGTVLQNMLESGCWTSEETVTLLDEITSTPEDWLAENVACLLYTAGPRIASLAITRKALTGQIGELAVTLTSLCLVRVKIHASLNELISLIGEACQAAEPTDRHRFLNHLARAFQDVIVDLYETDELEDRIEDFTTILRAQAEFMRALMTRIYEE
ncbi:unnamed protein product [Calicophoron daubneyi]|uniref:F-box domain-containing protein n=1 Tax=Calicophoron daubneyi TaxID=300641 RepID=A0AAV2TX34_CALDB